MSGTREGTRTGVREGERPPRGAPPGRAPDAGRVAPPVPMDPRIRRRRIEVRRDEGRRRRRILCTCRGVVAAAGAAVGAGRSPLFDVDYVDVRGAERTPRMEVLRAGRLTGRPAMLDVDAGRLETRLEALPWVQDATARRQWPGTIRIDLTERRPAALLPSGDGRWVMADRTGRVLEVGTEKPAGLPVLGNLPRPGAPGTTLAAAALGPLRVAAALPAALRPRVADVATVAGGEVELQLAPPGGVVRLGRPVGLAEKLAVLATVLDRADLAGVAVVDLRVPRAPALTRR
ncbi:MAG: cell division protein FtsQ/DivIB [Actinomycetota bacterium]